MCLSLLAVLPLNYFMIHMLLHVTDAVVSYCRQESDRLKSIRTWERRPLDTINTLKQLGIGRTRGLNLKTIQPFVSLQFHSCFSIFPPVLWCHLLGTFRLLRPNIHLSVHQLSLCPSVILLLFFAYYCFSLSLPFVNPSISLSVIPSFNNYLSSSVVLFLHLLSLFSSV